MNRFDFIKTNTDSVEKIKKVREACGALGDLFTELSPASREQSLALTNLEQAAFWMNRAICVAQGEAEM